MQKETRPNFFFDDKLFVGIIKFFDREKGFGFIGSNNYGMESPLRFRDKEQSFYIDNSSWKEPLVEKKLVTFQPVISHGKMRAMNVRLVNLETDRELIMDYYTHNNIITFEENIKQYSQCDYGRRHFEGYRSVSRSYSISTEAGICRYQTILDFTKKFTEDNDFVNLCNDFGILVSSVGGEEAYYGQISGNNTNTQFEHDALKKLFVVLNETQTKTIITQHPSVQMFATDAILLSMLDSIETKWVVSPNVKKVLEQKQEQERLTNIIAVIDGGMVELSREEVEQIRTDYSDKLDDDHKKSINNKIEELILTECESSIRKIGIGDINASLEVARNVCYKYQCLSIQAKSLFSRSLYATYSTNILNVVNQVSSLLWHNSIKQSVMRFVGNDEILKANDSNEIINAIKVMATEDFKRVFLQEEEKYTTIDGFIDYESLAKNFFTDDEYDQLLQTIQTRCLQGTSLFTIVKWFEYRKQLLPNTVIPMFVALDVEDIYNHASILRMFNDDNGLLLEKIFDKLVSTGDFVFYFQQSYDNDFSKNISFAKEIISIYGNELAFNQFKRLQYEDKITLYSALSLKIFTINELKQFLLNYDLSDYNKLLHSEYGKQAVLSIVCELDCSTSNGIEAAIKWLNRYIGEEPSDYYERNGWIQEISEITEVISASSNEYLKVVVWSMYFMSGGRLQLLRDIYYLFPADIQIQVLKKLFCAMALKKATPSLDWIESNIGMDSHYFSLPIMIVLKYLRLKIEDPNAHMTDSVMLSLFTKRNDYDNWHLVNKFLNNCNGQMYKTAHEDGTIDDSFLHFSGIIDKTNINGHNAFRLVLIKKQISIDNKETRYNNKCFEQIKEYIVISFPKEAYTSEYSNGKVIYDFSEDYERDVRIMANVFRIRMFDVNYNFHYKINCDVEKFCCECRLSNNFDNENKKPFMWCSNHACFHISAYFKPSQDWENYTVLDFMRILNIPTDYTNQEGETTHFGQYIIFSSYMQSFHEFFEHLKCRKCNKLMEPRDMSNFARTTITEFHCVQPDCDNKGKVVYLNRCFNKKCKHIIDSRDSKRCPNGNYICPSCGACCSTNKYMERYSHLRTTGGNIPRRLEELIQTQAGHWEKGEKFCYKCGAQMQNGSCPNCYITYER